MYKVFFKDRIVFLENDFSAESQIPGGLFYKYRNKKELKDLLHAFQADCNISELYIFHHDQEELRESFKSCFWFIRAAGGLVFNSKGKFLAIKRNGIWDLPKGKAERNEEPGTTALREVSEECGLKSIVLKKSIIKTYHTYHIDDKPVLKETEWFEMHTSGSEKTRPQIKEEITEARWFSRSELADILANTYPSIVDVFRESGLAYKE